MTSLRFEIFGVNQSFIDMNCSQSTYLVLFLGRQLVKGFVLSNPSQGWTSLVDILDRHARPEEILLDVRSPCLPLIGQNLTNSFTLKLLPLLLSTNLLLVTSVRSSSKNNRDYVQTEHRTHSGKDHKVLGF